MPPKPIQVGISGDSRVKKVGGHCGAKEKAGVNINVYLAW